jgi:hypothetical protein
MRNNYGYSTQVSVQNAGASAVDLTVTYSDGQVNSATALQPGASVTFNQLDETHAANTVFAGKISASTGGQIVATVVQVGDALFAYSGFGAGSTTPTFPAVNVNNYGYWTSILVQNLGTQPTDVTIAYTHTPGRAGTDCVETNTIPAGQAKRFVEYAFTWSKPGYGNVTDCTFGSTFVGAGKVTVNSNSQPLAAVVAQNDLRVEKMRGGSYSAFDSNGGSNVIVMPIIMDRNYGFWTSWFIQNAGTTSVAAGAITCNVKGKDINGTAVNINITNPDALTQDDVWLKDHINAIANRFVGGAICTGPVGSRLIAVVNQLGQTASDPWVGVDSFMTYEGINP